MKIRLNINVKVGKTNEENTEKKNRFSEHIHFHRLFLEKPWQ